MPWSVRLSVGVMAVVTVLIVWMSEILVATVEHASKALGLTNLFVGVVVVTRLGAAEFSPAYLVAIAGAATGAAITLATRALARRARELGIAMVHQELAFCPNLTIAENLCLGDLPKRFGIVSREQMRSKARAMLKEIECELDVNLPIRRLSTAQEQLVQIAGAVGTRAGSPMPLAPDQTHVWAGAHGDINLITALPRATAPGLQVLVNEQWVDAVAPDGQVIINTGMMLERLTNGVIPTGIHRVVAAPGYEGDRYSVVQFSHPTPWTLLQPLASCITPEHPQRYSGMISADALDLVLYEINLIEDARS